MSAEVLGIMWNRSDDTITISGFDGMTCAADVTKRDVLHSVARIFDPLGLCSPITVKGKIFLQKLWSVNVEWDECLSEDLVKEWDEIVRDLQQMSTLKICRFVGRVDQSRNQLLVFL